VATLKELDEISGATAIPNAEIGAATAAGCEVIGEGRSISATGAAYADCISATGEVMVVRGSIVAVGVKGVDCFSLGPEFHPPADEPNGERGDAASAAADAERSGLVADRAGLDAGRGVDDGTALCTPAPLVTPLSNSSRGSSR